MKISSFKIILVGILLCGCSTQESHENTPAVVSKNTISPTLASELTSPPPTPTPTASPLKKESNLMAPITTENIDDLEQVSRLGDGYIQDAVVSPDESMLAVYVGTNIDIYDIETFELKQSITAGQYVNEDFSYHNYERKILTFTSDSKKLIFPEGKEIVFWDLMDNKELNSFASLIPEWRIVDIALTPLGDRVVVTTLGSSYRCQGRDMNFALYDLDGRLIFDRYTCADYSNNFFRFTNDEKILFIFASMMTMVYPTQTFLIDEASGTILENTHAEYLDYEKPKPNVELLYDISPDGQILAYAAYNRGDEKLNVRTKLVDFETQQVIHEQDGRVEFFTDQGQTRWQTISDNNLSTESEAGICNLDNPNQGDTYKLLSSTSKQAVFAVTHSGMIESIELWNIPGCTFEKMISYPAADHAIISPDGQWIASTDGYHAYVWEVQTGQLHFTVAGKAFESPKEVIQFNMDGSRFLVSSYGRENHYPDQPDQIDTISVFDTQTGQLLRELKPDGDFLYSFSATPEKDLVIAQGKNNPHVWNIETGQKLATLPKGAFVFDSQVGHIWIAPEQENDDKTILKIFLYNYHTGEQVRKLGQVYTEGIRGIYLDSSDTKMLAHLFLGQGKENGVAVVIFDIKNDGRKLLSYKLPWSNFDMVAYGNSFATNDWYGYVHLWNYESDAPVLTLWGNHPNWKVSDHYKDAEGKDDGYATLAKFNAIDTMFFDESILITQGATIRFWDTNSGYLLGEMKPDYSIDTINISPEHNLIAVVGYDGIIRLWGVPNEP